MDAETLIARMSARSTEPGRKLLCLFELLSEHIAQQPQPAAAEQIFNPALNKYCVKLSQQAHANHPKILADHILFIAQNAYQQEVAHPENKSLAHAKKVAQALLLAQTHTPANFLQRIQQPKILAGAFISTSIVLISGWLYLASVKNTSPEKTPVAEAGYSKPTRSLEDGLTAQEASAMYTKFEMMRKGTCRYLEAIQIPDQDKAVYLENVVGGKLPTNLKDLATANAYLEKIDCNYTPMLMQKSK